MSAPCRTMVPARSRLAIWATLLAATTLLAGQAVAQSRVAPENMPGPLKEVGFDQRLGEQLPLDARFLDEQGQNVTLGSYFGERPVVMAFAYYECPMLCSLVVGGLTKALNVVAFEAGEQYEVVVVSIDPGETPALAAEAKAEYLGRYEKIEQSTDGWHFLTGEETEIQRVTEAAGFRYVYDRETDEYAHASGVLVATPDGKISQYYYGVEYAPKNLRLAMVEASSNGIGSLIDQVMLYCYKYDPKLGKYTAVAMRMVRLAGVVFVLLLLTFFLVMWRWERRKHNNHTPTLGPA